MLGLVLIYWVVLLIPYGYLDDYFWLEVSVKQPVTVFIDQAVQGRPLNGYILQFIFSHAGGLVGLWRVRMLILIEMSGMGWMFYIALRRAGVEMRNAILLAMLACVVPATQVYAAWATSVGNPISAMFACGAAILCGWSQDNPRRRWLGLPGAVALLTISATIYQPTAMVFWPMAGLELFRRENRECIVRRFLAHLAVAMIALAIAFAVFKYGLAHHPERPSIQRSGITHDPIGKISWYFQHPLVDSLNLYNMIRPVPAVAILVAAFLIAGFLRVFPGTFKERLTPFLIAAALFPLAYLPNLAAQENWASYRTQIGMEWLVIVLAFLALRAIVSEKATQITLIILSVAAASLVTYQAGLLISFPQCKELIMLKKLIDQPDVANSGRIILLQPESTSSFQPLASSRYDEFARTSLHEDWVPQSEVNLIRRQENRSLPRIEVELRKGFVGPWTEALPPGTAVVDMRPAGRN